MSHKDLMIGILSPGDMGHTVGNVLRENGARVITCLEGRSQRTEKLTEDAGIEIVDSYPALVEQADLLLSILVPAQALPTATKVASALASTNTSVLYVDCNAIAPETTRQIERVIVEAEAQFADASIIGPPPRRPGITRFYTSGKDAGGFEKLNEYGLQVVSLGDEIGHASAIKMCYAALTKGTSALAAELFTAASAMGVFEPLVAEFQLSQSERYESLSQSVARIPMKSRRWVGEMEEIAKSFENVGLTPKIIQGAADVYRLMGSTTLADRTPEDTTPFPSLEETVTELVKKSKKG